jgi:hypothetical protein
MKLVLRVESDGTRSGGGIEILGSESNLNAVSLISLNAINSKEDEIGGHVISMARLTFVLVL